jgi:hypothetical protein
MPCFAKLLEGDTNGAKHHSCKPRKPSLTAKILLSFYPHASLTLSTNDGVTAGSSGIQTAHKSLILFNSLAGKGS